MLPPLRPRRSPRRSLQPEQPAAPVADAAPATASQPPPQAAPDAPPGEPVAANQTIRVTVDVLEDLMTLVSELVLTRNQLLQLARTQENNSFAVPLQRLSHITTDLQEGVMKTRMQPSHGGKLLKTGETVKYLRRSPLIYPHGCEEGGASFSRAR